MCECGGELVECLCGDRCCVYCGCRDAGVWVEPIDTPTKPPYGSTERAAYDAAGGYCPPGPVAAVVADPEPKENDHA